MLEKIRAAFIEDCEDDFVGLWDYVRDIRETYPNWSDEKIMAETLNMLRDLLDNGIIMAVETHGSWYSGEPPTDLKFAFKTLLSPSNTSVFIPSKSDTESIIQKMKTEWDALGRDPKIPELTWFTNSNYECPIDIKDLESDGSS